MKYLKLYSLLTSIFLSFGLFAQFPEFAYEEIVNLDDNLLCQQSLADLDNDNDLDIITGSNVGTIWWLENTGDKNWTKRLIGDYALTNKGSVTADIDGDGFIDVISGGTWFKNPGNKESEWSRFENGGIIAYDMQAADLNNDGTLEIISVNHDDGTFIYYPGNNPEKKWKAQRIGDGCPGGIAPNGIGDLDGDKDIDIVRSNLWFDNLKGDGSKWSEHKVLRFVQSTGKYAYSSRVFVIDMDKDGDLDVVQSQSNNENSGIIWHENKDGRGITWYRHQVVSDTKQDFHSLCVEDFDNDGDLDIFSGGGPLTDDLYKRCFIWENSDATGEKWVAHEILIKIECIDPVAGDIDNDGDIDIISKPWQGNTVYLLRNELIKQ